MTEGALSTVRVVEYGNLISAPFCTKLLAGFGAEVIKVEEPESGDESRKLGPFLNDVPHPERSGLFLNLNTNKLGITLNAKTATGRNILKKLLKEADVFVENYPPLVKELEFDYATLKELNPRLIVASITPYGRTGLYKDYKGYDINFCAASGVSVGIGYPQQQPLMLPASLGSYLTGLGAALGVLFALFARDLTDRGQLVDVSEAEVPMLALTAYHIATYVYRGISGLRAGQRMGLGLYPNGVFKCKDGHVCLDIPPLALWLSFLELLDNPEWTKNPRYRDRRAMAEQYPDEVDAFLAPWLMAHTKEEIFTACQAKHIPCAPIRTIEEVVNDRHLKERGFFVEVDHPEAGVLKYPGEAYRFSNTPWRISRPAPLLGEHNEEIYCARLGYSKEDLLQLRRAGII